MVDYKEGDWVERSDRPARDVTANHVYKVIRLDEDGISVHVLNDVGVIGSYWRSEFRLAKNKIVIDILKDL